MTGSPAPSPLWVIRLQQPVPMPTCGPEENHGPTLAHHPSGPSNSPLLGDLPLRAALSRQGDPAATRGPMRMRPSSRAWQGPLSSSDSTSSLSGSLPHLTRGQHPRGVVLCFLITPGHSHVPPGPVPGQRGEGPLLPSGSGPQGVPPAPTSALSGGCTQNLTVLGARDTVPSWQGEKGQSQLLRADRPCPEVGVLPQ